MNRVTVEHNVQTQFGTEDVNDEEGNFLLHTTIPVNVQTQVVTEEVNNNE